MTALADFPLVGFDPPRASRLDGDFDDVKSNKRQLLPSPHWTTQVLNGSNVEGAGIQDGTMSSGGKAIVRVSSPVLDRIAEYAKPIAGDRIHWRFAARSEHQHDATVSMSLVFGDQERVQIVRKPVSGGPAEFNEFAGDYIFTEDDAALGMPIVSFTLSSSDGVRVYLDYVDVWIADEATSGPRNLRAGVRADGVQLNWDTYRDSNDHYSIFRSPNPRKGYQRIASDVASNEFLDKSIINGVINHYVVTRTAGKQESSASSVVTAQRLGTISPAPPTALDATALDSEIKLRWKSDGDDIHHYTVLRGSAFRGANKKDLRVIVDGLTKTEYMDFTPDKGANRYVVRAVDHSGNVSEPSAAVQIKTKTVLGASFRDLVQPMPVGDGLRSDLWGAGNVLPRNPNNGIEDPYWSYWGGHPIKGKDGKYHMLICRWPEGNVKGHWQWYYSTVVHAVSDDPLGPYVPTAETAYEWDNGVGHNPGLTPLNDGTYMLHLRGGHVLTSANVTGPWKYEGIYTVDYNGHDNVPKHNTNQYVANVVGIQREDGSLLFITKWGATMISSNGILGPYVVQNKPVVLTGVVPKLYRAAYEDPAFWRDENQYHMIINGFIARRAIYLRSPDGIHWKLDPGTAYDPEVTSYEDGTRTRWDILERPHVLQDQHGRATHLSLAVLDVYKYDDFANDGHSSKNIMLPLTVHRRLKVLSKDRVDQNTEQIKVLILSEEGFDAQNDIDVSSLRFGASEEVNFGRGAMIITSTPHADGVVVTFAGSQTGLTDDNFVCKLLGRTKDGELLIGFSKRQQEKSSE